ncbi:UNVERIFIED_CONTAM: hypothetical protein FKN15_015611 [Acipenser sinensis]
MSESRIVESAGTQNGAHRCGDHPAGNLCVVGNKVTVVLGAQWGDEGKGKVVDLLAQDADIVCRCQSKYDPIRIGSTSSGSDQPHHHEDHSLTFLESRNLIRLVQTIYFTKADLNKNKYLSKI